MLNVDLETLGYFPSVSLHEVGYLGPVSPNRLNAPIPVKQV